MHHTCSDTTLKREATANIDRRVVIGIEKRVANEGDLVKVQVSFLRSLRSKVGGARANLKTQGKGQWHV
jgi:hypothetical protein